MKLRNRGFIALGSTLFSLFFLSGCGKVDAPNLSFEETLNVYSNQMSSLKDIAAFMNDSENQIESSLKLKSDFNVSVSDESQMDGSLTLESSAVADKKTMDSELSLKANLDANGGKEENGGFGKMAANLGLDSIVKDYQIFVKINELNVSMDEESTANMINSVVEGFKGQWISFGNEEIVELLKTASSNNTSLRNNPELYEERMDFYTGVESTIYDGYPAWKVDVNMEEVKKQVLEIYDQQEASLYSGNELSLEEQQEIRENIVSLLDTLQLDNVEAYFVIRSADKVDFVVDNMDILLGEGKINLKKEVDGNKSTVTVFVKEKDSDKDGLKIKILLDKVKKTTYKVSVSAVMIEEGNERTLFDIGGTIKASLSESSFLLQPEISLKSESFNASISCDFQSKKISDHEFVAPEESMDIEDLFGGFFGTSEYEDVYGVDNGSFENEDLEDNYEFSIEDENDDRVEE